MIGTTISHYRVVAKLGAGGMGEVYRATDTRLGRDVAIKVLPDVFAGDTQRLARFEREAQLLASLNHPHIASIYGFEEVSGSRALVMELVEGPTLAEQIQQGALPLDESVRIAGQIAQAFEAAHARGIIHRDLKPANVKLTADGAVKILDFGLAKALDAPETPADLSRSPTLSVAATRAGMVLGTAAYMSPEQARGKSADKRADIWAFGLVLFEMLAGRSAFRGETVTDLLAAVVKEEPDWSALPAETPPALRRLLRRCLQKDPSRRLHDIADARLELEESLAEPPDAPARLTAPAAAQPAARRALPWALAAVFAVTAAVLGWQILGEPARPAGRQMHFTIALPPQTRLADPVWPVAVLSPDGSLLVMEVWRSGTTQLYLRRMDQLEAAALPGTEDATKPFFSPDGKWIGFTAGRKLKKVAVTGGTPQELCDVDWGGGAWLPDDNIVFTQGYPTGLWRVSASGGTPEKLTEPDRSKGELGHWWPQLLPDGETILFTNFSTPVERARIETYSLRSGERKTLVTGALHGRYVPTGHLVFARGETLMAVPMDAKRLEVTGTPLPVLDDVSVDTTNGSSQFSFSADGSLAYVPASTTRLRSRLVWVDRTGRVQPFALAPRAFAEPRLSPDGQRLALSIWEQGRDVWVYDLARGSLTRVTSGPAAEFMPLWTRDGRRLAFISEKPIFDLFLKAADGTGAEEMVLASPFDKYPQSFTPDGRTLVFAEISIETGSDVLMLPLEGERKPVPVANTRFDEEAPQLSPDGRWLAYQSNESGRNEVYVQPFPGPGERHQVSTDGGTEPLWSRAGRELFYRQGDKLLSVPLRPGAAFQAGKPVVLFEGSFEHFTYHAGYDISPDGRRFVMVQRDPDAPPAQVRIVLNWFDELRRRVPVRK